MTGVQSLKIQAAVSRHTIVRQGTTLSYTALCQSPNVIKLAVRPVEFPNVLVVNESRWCHFSIDDIVLKTEAAAARFASNKLESMPIVSDLNHKAVMYVTYRGG
jgi:hypothetical protein